MECEALDASSSGSEWDNDWHLASLFIVVGASALGVFLPIISQTVRGFGHHVVVPSFALQAGQFFGAGVIVATAFIHLFPAATDALTNPCLGAFADKYGAWASLFAMAAVFTMHSVEWWLIEAWVSRADYGRSEADDAESAVDGAYPRYSNAFNASRLTGMLPLPPPMLSPPVNPLVFGASTRSLSMHANHVAGYAQQPSTYNSARTGFALTRHGNYATLARSKYQLALLGACNASTDRVARYLRSEPQFPLCAPSIAATHRSHVRPHYHPRGILVRGSIQAKSTPELMPKSTTIGARMLQYQQQHSTVSSSKNNTASSKAISLRPNSFTRKSIKRISGASSKRNRHRMSAGVYRVSGAAAGNGWRHRCLSMPRLPPTTLDAGMCESLLGQQQQQQQPSHHMAASPATQSTSSSSQKRRSSMLSPPRRLDPVPEDARPAQIATSDDDDDDDEYAGSVAPVFTTATMHMYPHKSPTYSMFGSTKPKRVSIPTPPTAAPSSCVYQSLGAGLVRQNPPYVNAAARSADPSQPAAAAAAAAAAPGFDSDSAAESTAIHSSKQDGKEPPPSRRLYPVEVQRRALATYVLELGIALYSVLVGLALATTGMRGFFALLVAVCFHQFFEGLALGTSLAELYWVKAQLASELQMEQNAASRGSGAREQPQCIDEEEEEEEEEQGPDAHTCSDDFEYVSVDPIGIQARARSKSRRTLASMATSFTPEPWQVNPNIEQNIDGTTEPAAGERPRYLQHRAGPDRFPGWWKAWLSAMVFTATTPTGIVVGLALRSVYEPQSRYALLLNGVLQSICTGILAYAGLVTLLVGGFSSFQVKQLPRYLQLVLFLAVYAGAAVMAAVKIWT